MKPKILLLDVDGVLALPPKLFSDVYCEQYGIDPATLQTFYSTKEFQQALLGKFDLKEAIRIHNDLWQWKGDFNGLVAMWLQAENYPNENLLKIITDFRQAGGLVYLATQQERYRAAYIKDVMFKDDIDGMFSSCDIGADKHDPKFWLAVLNQLESVSPETIAYFDDRQTIVDAAKIHGINAHLYPDITDVTAVL